jgi:histidinol-phosphate aminotransferase
MTWSQWIPDWLRREYGPEYANLREERPVLVDCALGCNPLGTPESARRVLERASFGVDTYPADKDSLVREICSCWKDAFGPEQLFFGCGSIGVLSTIARSLCGPGARVIGMAPQFTSGLLAFRLSGSDVSVVPLDAPDYTPDTERIASSVTEETALVYFDRPHNPTGWTAPLDDVVRLADRCAESGAFLIVDEAYGDYIPREESAMTLFHDSIICVRSFSKGWGLAGLRAGYGVLRDPRAMALLRILEDPFPLNSVALAVLPEVMKDAEYPRRTREAVTGVKRRVLECAGATPGVSVARTDPAVPIMLVCDRREGNLYERLMKVGIRTEPGECFERIGACCVRLRVPAPSQLSLFGELWPRAFA